MVLWLLLPVLSLLTLLGVVAHYVRSRHMRRWLGPYLRRMRQTPPLDPTRDVHLLLCIADHYEPKAGGTALEPGLGKVRRWLEEYPRRFGRFRDSDGKPPRYSFFFPAEEYEPAYLDALAALCKQGFGEVEIHLHHDNDTPAGFRDKLIAFRDILAKRHGLLSRQRGDDRPVYAFIHGDWALCNSRPDGACCGVNDELAILRETGCYVDMTFPSAPDVTQPPRVNEIYYARNLPGRPASHEVGVEIGTGAPPDDALMLITGPMLLDWRKRKWGIFPTLENGCLQDSQPPMERRIDSWLRARVQVPGRPDWFFAKLHAHGCEDASQEALLGETMVRFHEALARRAQSNPCFHYHYVTAREMYNLARAAEAGFQGSVDEARDFELVTRISDKR